MRKLIPTILAATVLVVLSLNAHIDADSAPGGEDLKTTADGLRTSLLSGTTTELFNKLAPWLRGRASLNRETFVARIQASVDEVTDGLPEGIQSEYAQHTRDSIAKSARERDPAKRLGVSTFEDYAKLAPEDMYALDIGQLMLQDDADLKEHREAKWYEVDRAIYNTTERLKWDQEANPVERTYGKVAFVNQFDDAIVVTCVFEGSTWRVEDFRARIGALRCHLRGSQLMSDPMMRIVRQEAKEQHRLEGEQLMGSGRDYSRIEWAKTGNVPKKFTASMKADEFEEELHGKFFTVRDTIYKKPDMERNAIVVDPVDDESLG